MYALKVAASSEKSQKELEPEPQVSVPPVEMNPEPEPIATDDLGFLDQLGAELPPPSAALKPPVVEPLADTSHNAVPGQQEGPSVLVPFGRKPGHLHAVLAGVGLITGCC